MVFLFFFYFIFDFWFLSCCEVYFGDVWYDGGNYWVIELEYFFEMKLYDSSSKWKWFGFFVVGIGIWVFFRCCNKNKEVDFDWSSYRFGSCSCGFEVILLRRGLSGYYEDEKYIEVLVFCKSGGGFMKFLGGVVVMVGVGVFVLKLMSRGKNRDDEYFVVLMEILWCYRVGWEIEFFSEWSSEVLIWYWRDDVELLFFFLVGGVVVMVGVCSVVDLWLGRLVILIRLGYVCYLIWWSFEEDIEYLFYVSFLRRELEFGRGGGMVKGIFVGFGMGWLGKKLVGWWSKK